MWHVISTRANSSPRSTASALPNYATAAARDDGADRGSVGSLRIFLSQPSVIWAKMELRHVKCYMAARPPGGASPAESAMPPSLAPLAPLPFLSQGDPGAFQPSGSSAAARSVDSAVDARAPEIPVRPRARPARSATHRLTPRRAGDGGLAAARPAPESRAQLVDQQLVARWPPRTLLLSAAEHARRR